MFVKIINLLNAILLTLQSLVTPIYQAPQQIPQSLSVSAVGVAPTTNQQQALSDNKKIYPVQLVNQSGFQFYFVEIKGDDTQNAKNEEEKAFIRAFLSTSPIPSNILVNLLTSLKYPSKLTKNIVFAFVDPSMASPDIYIKLPNGNDLATNFSLPPEGGATSTSLPYGTKIIFINDSFGSRSSLSFEFSPLLTHELGHSISDKLTSDEWLQYYKLRNIPIGTPRYNTENWNLSPEEDFAEVYKATFMPRNSINSQMDENNWTVRTAFGILKPSFLGQETSDSPCFKIDDKLKKDWIDKNIPKDITGGPDAMKLFNLNFDKVEQEISKNQELQKCRKDIVADSQKNKNVGLMTTFYESSVDEKTKQFMQNLLLRLK